MARGCRGLDGASSPGCAPTMPCSPGRHMHRPRCPGHREGGVSSAGPCGTLGALRPPLCPPHCWVQPRPSALPPSKTQNCLSRSGPHAGPPLTDPPPWRWRAWSGVTAPHQPPGVSHLPGAQVLGQAGLGTGQEAGREGGGPEAAQPPAPWKLLREPPSSPGNCPRGSRSPGPPCATGTSLSPVAGQPPGTTATATLARSHSPVSTASASGPGGRPEQRQLLSRLLGPVPGFSPPGSSCGS